jgi:hypothetical protein
MPPHHYLLNSSLAPDKVEAKLMDTIDFKFSHTILGKGAFLPRACIVNCDYYCYVLS